MYRIGPCLVELRRNGCDIYIVGHSMGGGVAALLTYLLLHTDTMKYRYFLSVFKSIKT